MGESITDSQEEKASIRKIQSQVRMLYEETDRHSMACRCRERRRSAQVLVNVTARVSCLICSSYSMKTFSFSGFSLMPVL